MVAGEEAVEKNSLKPLARIVDWFYVGCEPTIMGIGPVPAIKGLLNRTGLKLSDISIIEINEAFAAQVLAVCKVLEISPADVN